MAKEDTARNGFLKGMLKEQITRESLVGAGPNQVRRWIEIHLIPADYGQYLAVFHETTGEHDIREQLADAPYTGPEQQPGQDSVLFLHVP